MIGLNFFFRDFLKALFSQNKLWMILEKTERKIANQNFIFRMREYISLETNTHKNENEKIFFAKEQLKKVKNREGSLLFCTHTF